MRTTANGDRLRAAVEGDAYILEGGLDAWIAAGLPVEEDRKAPLEAMNACCFRFGGTVEARRAMKQFHARLEEGWREPYAYIAPLPR